MNAYFICLSLYWFLTLPVSVRVNAAIGGGASFRITAFISGIPIIVRSITIKIEEGSLYFYERGARHKPEKRKKLSQAASFFEDTLMLLAASKPFRRLVKDTVSIRRLILDIVISLQSAKNTALAYSFIVTLMETLALCGASPRTLTLRVRPEFGGPTDARAKATCILFFRLGSLFIALAAARAFQNNIKEARYAASD